MLWHPGPPWPGRDCPSQGELIPRDDKQRSKVCAFHMQTHQARDPTSQLPPLSSSYIATQ